MRITLVSQKPLSRPGRVLVVDDSAGIRRDVRKALGALGDVDLMECGDGLTALQMMAEHHPDLVVCDLLMPKCDGFTLLRMRASKPELASIPVLMLTGAEDREARIQVLEQGASDFISKPFHGRELVARARIQLRSRMLQEKLEEANERLRLLSCTDGLTGLFNRRHLEQVLETEVTRLNRYGVAVSVLLLDIDHFKNVNDTHGHAVGDAVLRRVADTLASMTRKVDVVARYGGEEVCLVLANTRAQEAQVLAERLRAGLAEVEHETTRGPVRVTVSIGIASADRAPTTVDTMLARADGALYTAKRAGRNRVVTWSATLDRLRLEELNRACSTG